MATALMQHLLFLFLLVVAPIWDLYDARKLMRNPSSEKKIRYYKKICAWLWIASASALVAVGFRPLFTVSLSPGEISWRKADGEQRAEADGNKRGRTGDPEPGANLLIVANFVINSVALPVGTVIW